MPAERVAVFRWLFSEEMGGQPRQEAVLTRNTRSSEVMGRREREARETLAWCCDACRPGGGWGAWSRPSSAQAELDGGL